MKKWWMALLTALALSVGVAWAEGKHGETKADGKNGSACCCCGDSCHR